MIINKDILFSRFKECFSFSFVTHNNYRRDGLDLIRRNLLPFRIGDVEVKVEVYPDRTIVTNRILTSFYGIKAKSCIPVMYMESQKLPYSHKNDRITFFKLKDIDEYTSEYNDNKTRIFCSQNIN